MLKINTILNNLLSWILTSRWKERNLYLFAGLEPVMRYRHKTGIWEIKTEDCSRCGKCCKLITKKHVFATENGCKHLTMSGNEYLCGLGIFRPHGCSIAEIDTVNCSVVWEPVE